MIESDLIWVPYMFAEKRLKKVKELLRQYKTIEISSLSSILSVSEATVRRDLDKLEAEGLIKRIHGGAVLIEEEDDALAFQEQLRSIANLEEKKSIGRIASNLVQNNDVIIIGSGTTCYQLACHLKDKKNLTIVTNNMLIGMELSACSDIRVIMTGGNVYRTENSVSLVGDFSNKTLEEIHVNKAFMGVDGVDIDNGFSVNSMELALVWNQIVKISENLIVLSDYTKFDKKAFIRLGPLEMASKIVTNDKVPDVYKQYFFEKLIPIYTGYQLSQ